eukprot:6202316-Pleurochrysis_carterae.AAC.1
MAMPGARRGCRSSWSSDEATGVTSWPKNGMASDACLLLNEMSTFAERGTPANERVRRAQAALELRR